MMIIVNVYSLNRPPKQQQQQTNNQKQQQASKQTNKQTKCIDNDCTVVAMGDLNVY